MIGPDVVFVLQVHASQVRKRRDPDAEHVRTAPQAIAIQELRIPLLRRVGTADLIAINPNKSLILLIQCKKGKLSANEKYKALLPLKALEGYYKVEALLV